MTTNNNGPTLHHDLYRTGPGTIAGRYMRMYWHPVYAAEQLKPGWAKPIRIMGEDFTLYRGESGTPHLVTPSQFQFTPVVEVRRVDSPEVLTTILTQHAFVLQERAIEFGFILGREWIDKRLAEP
jgi:hypothetical protein